MKNGLEECLKRKDIPDDVKDLIRQEILERNQIEAALKEHEAKFRAVVENSLQGLLIFQDRRIIFANSAIAELSGYKVTDLINLSIEDYVTYIHPEDRTVIMRRLQDRLAGKLVPTRYEFRYFHKNGEVRWVEMFVSLIEYEGRLAICGAFIDINEHKRAEAALKYRAEFETLLSSISSKFINIRAEEIDQILVDVLRAIGEFVKVDRSYIFLLNKSETEIIKTYEWCSEGIEPNIAHLESLNPADFSWWMDQLRKFRIIPISQIADIPPLVDAIELLKIRGTKSLLVVPMFYEENLVGVLGLESVRIERTWSEETISLLKIVSEIFTNALVYNRTERELQETKEKYQTLVEELQEGVLVEDSNKIITFVNPRVTKMLGYKEEELIGQHWKIIVTPEFIDQVNEETQKRYQGISSTYECSLQAKNGTLVHVIISAKPLFNDMGKLEGILSVFTDITKRKQAEDKLTEASAAVEELNESLKIINSILRHDLLNDLTLIRGLLELFEFDRNEETLKKTFTIMERSANLIAQMKELEHLVIQKEALIPYDVKRLVKSVLVDYVTHTVEFNVKGEGSVLADQALVSVLDNLIRNAIIHAKTDCIDINIAEQDDLCEIRVIDYGPGIPDKIKPKIFNPGFKYGKTGQRGLGLYIVKKVVERYGGNIRVENNSPTGSVFVLKLKAAKTDS
ncbi:MAG: PAS domain S-box protein [Candidatus Hodarchaeota archaeon]